MTRFRRVAGVTFKSLRTRNYRLWFVGQTISVSGTWMQSIALAWLVLRLAPRADQGIDLGLNIALQFLPMLLLGTWGGLIADRFDKRRILYGTQASAGVLALVLAMLTVTGTVRLWHVYLLALLLGVVNLFDNPTRQSFVVEMVGKDDLPNAVSLNSIVMNGARVIGPAIGGALIATVGIAICFEVNAASYVAVIVALALMRRSQLYRTELTPRAKGQLREGSAIRVEDARPARRAARGIRCGDARLQLHRHAPALRQVDVPRGSRRLLAAHFSHGGGGGHGRARCRQPGSSGPGPPRDGGDRVRLLHPCARARRRAFSWRRS